MADVVEPFVADLLAAGLSIRSMDFSATLEMSKDCYNVSQAFDIGYGPRYGFAPLISQCYGASAGGDSTWTFKDAQTATDYKLTRIYSIIPVPMLDQTDIGTTTAPKLRKTYFWVAAMFYPSTGNRSGEQLFAWFPLGLINDGSVTSIWTPKSAFAYGICKPFILLSNAAIGTDYYPMFYRFSTSITDLESYLNVDQPTGNVDYCQTAVFTQSGINEPAPWIVGAKITAGDATHSATACFTALGTPNFPIDRKIIDKTRVWKLYNVGTTNGLEAEYDFAKQPTLSDLKAIADQDISQAHLTGTYVTGSATKVNRVDGTAPTYANVQFVLWNDCENVMNTEYTLLLAAPRKALAMMIQGWQRSNRKCLEQWVDLRNPKMAPPPLDTLGITGAGSRYTESGMVTANTSATPVNTCWYAWPPFSSLAALTQLSAVTRTTGPYVVPCLGAPNTGILRANTTYEMTFAVYDKMTGYESNVGVPAKFRTDSNDYVCLCLWADEMSAGSGGYYRQRAPGLSSSNFLWNYSTYANRVNYTQFRVYFRPLGQFEWLPALQIDAADYFFNPNHKEILACTGPIPGSTGGQPGAFNDYSPLPDDQYTSVLVWKNRVFWLSDKTLIFSLPNNAFAYPIRNAFNIQNGSYKGAIVHNYPGQADQDSRLVVFGSQETYVGKFTGERQQMAVQVDANNLGTFFVDGTDFVLNTWTSVTAFSYRSACVADGILYWWGPKGVYRDDGVETPTKISAELEPLLSTLYSKQKTDDIHCIYNSQTREIIWFYFNTDDYTSTSSETPKTRLLVYNTRTEKFLFQSVPESVDAAQQITTGDGVDLVRATGGTRIMTYNRPNKATTTDPQMAYFFDQRNRGGDFTASTQRIVSAIATPVAGQRRFTLLNGADGISVGDLIATDQIAAYTGEVDSGGSAIVVEDFIGKVTAVNTFATPYIDVLLPTDINPSFVGSATLDALTSFPIYVGTSEYNAVDASRGNAIPYSFETTYWCPNGLKYNARWLYAHLLFKLNLLKAEGLDQFFGVDFYHKSCTSPSYVSEFLTFGTRTENGEWTSVLNSDGNQQIYHPLDIGEDNFEGQGLKYKIAGLHFAHQWVLQYLAMYANPQTYDFLKMFEG